MFSDDVILEYQLLQSDPLIPQMEVTWALKRSLKTPKKKGHWEEPGKRSSTCSTLF